MGASSSHLIDGHLSFSVLTRESAAEALTVAETHDNYLEDCDYSEINRFARKGTIYSPITLADSQIVELQRHISRISVPHILTTSTGHVKVAVLMPSADGGMPHTRPNSIICFPHSAHPIQPTTLVHELWHIHQRKFPQLWKKIYTDVWGFTPFSEKHLPVELAKYVRINPDTMAEPFYIWRNRWIPIVTFAQPQNPYVRETVVWFYNMNTGSYSRILPDDMAAFFSGSLPAGAYEHPNELSAYMLSDPTAETKQTSAYKSLIAMLGIDQR